MGQWVEEKPTMDLRWHVYWREDGEMRWSERVLQQLWKITKGGTGRVYYVEEWRDVRIVDEKDKGDGR